jgi:hypothetical protein
MKAMKAPVHSDGIVRCPWPKDDALYVAYHDQEWGVPEYDDRALYEKLMLDGFQAGLSWITILRKRDNFRRAFDDFVPEKIVRYRPAKVERLMQDAGIVRNRSKIEGAVRSARAWLDIMDKVGLRRRSTKSQSLQISRPSAGGDRNLARDLQGTGAARLQILRADHRLRLHAGGRHGQRSPGHLLSPCGVPEARVARPWLTRRSAPGGRRDRHRSHAPGSACCRGAGSICSIRRRSTSSWKTLRMAWRA